MSVKLVPNQPDDMVISQISNAVILLDMMMSTLTLPLQFVILWVLLKEKAYSGSFFTIYKVGLLYDIAGFICVNIVAVIPSRGILLDEKFAESQFYLKLYFFLAHSTHACQMATNPILCLNRATAVLLPLYHRRIWDNRFWLPLCFLNQLLFGLLVGLQTIPLEHFQIRYATGERFPLLADSPATRLFWLETFVVLFSAVLFMFMLYGLIIWKFRTKLTHHKSTTEKAENRRAFSLLIIAVSVLVPETIYCLFYGYYFVTNINYNVDFRSFMAAFYTLIYVNSCLPSFLLLFFCKLVRDQVAEIILSRLRWKVYAAEMRITA